MHIGYLIVLDTNCINARQKDSSMNELEQLADEGRIDIETTDTSLNELGGDYPKGEKKAGKYIFSMGSMVLGHSKFGTSVLGSKEDDDRLGELLDIFFEHKHRWNYSDQEMGDAMQISTAIRYGAKFFVTRDRKLLYRSDEVKNKFEIIIANPESCLLAVKDRLETISTF